MMSARCPSRCLALSSLVAWSCTTLAQTEMSVFNTTGRAAATTFVTDYQAFSQCSDVRMRYFGVASPTSTTIQISGLAQPEAMVEIEMIAVAE